MRNSITGTTISQNSARGKRSRILKAAALAALLLAPATHADLIWDPDGVGGMAGMPLGGAGTWDAGNKWIKYDDTYTLWSAGEQALFQGTAGAVNVSAPTAVNWLRFDVTGYTLSGAALNLVSGSYGNPAINVLNSTDTVTIDNVLTGTEGLSKYGSGTAVLTATNLFSGTLTIADGRLSVAQVGSLGNVTDIYNYSSTGGLLYTGATSTIGANMSGGGRLTISNAATNLTLSGAASSLIKAGPGTLTLTNTSNSGTLSIEEGTVDMSTGAPLTFSGLVLGSSTGTMGRLHVANASGTVLASMTLEAGGGEIAVDAGTLEFGNAITKSSSITNPTAPLPPTTPGLTKTGAGKLRLSAQAATQTSDYVGTVMVKEGILEITGDRDLGNGYNGVVLDGGTLQIITPAPVNGIVDPGGADTATNSKFRVFYIGDAGGTFDLQMPTGHLQINDGPAFATLNQLQSLNYNPAGSPDVLTKTGSGRMLVGNTTDDYGTAFSGTTVIKNGLLRADGAKALGNFQITVTTDGLGGVGTLGNNAPGIMPNPLVINGGKIGSSGGDRLFGGSVNLQTPLAFSSQDVDNVNPIDRSTVFLGAVTDNSNAVTITGNPGNTAKGLVLGNTSTLTPNVLTGAWTVQSGGALLIGGSGTVAGTDNAVAVAPASLTLLDGSGYGFRSDSGTTFGNYPALPATSFGLSVGPLTNSAITGVSLITGPLTLTGQTVAIGGTNDYRLAPTTASYTAGTTLDFQGGTLAPGILTNGGSTGTVVLKGNGTGGLLINTEAGGPHAINGTNFDLQTGGRLIIQGGTAGVNPLGTASTAFNGGAIGLTSSVSGAVFDFPITVAAAGSDGNIQHFGNVSNSYVGTLTIDGGKTANVSVAGTGVLTFTQPFSGSGSIAKTGTGTMGISADNTGFTGSVSVSAGKLSLSNAAGKSVPGALSVSNATVDLSGTTQTVGSVAMTSGSIINGTLNTTSLTKSGGPLSSAQISARLESTGGTIVAAGGALRITNTATGPAANSLTSTTTVSATSGGTVEVPSTFGGSNPLGAATVSLDGGNLVLTGTSGYSATANGLTGTFYNLTRVSDNGQNGWIGFNSLSNLETELARWVSAGSTLATGFNFTNIETNSYRENTPAPMSLGIAATTSNAVAVFRGQINIATAGDYKFTTQSDDGSVMFIDGVKVVENNFDQGSTDRISGAVNLTAGMHDIVIAHYQGTGGGALINVGYMGPDMFSRAGITAITHSTIVDASANDVIATGNSSITVRDAGVANFGKLSLGGGTLRLTGAISPSTIELTAPATIDTSLLGGAILTGASSGAHKLTKTGPGGMVWTGPLSHTGGTEILAGSLRVTAINAIPTVGDTVIGNGASLVVPINANLANVVVNPGGLLNLSVSQVAASGAVAPTAAIGGTVRLNNYDLSADYDGLKVAAGGTVDFVQGGADRNHRGDITLSGNGQVTFNQNGGNTVNWFGAINVAAGSTVGLTMTGGSTLHLQGNSAINGPIIVESGTLRFRDAGVALSVPSTTIYGGSFTISDGGSTTVQNRYNDAGSVILRNGTFRGQMRSNGGTANEVFGEFIAAGTGTIQLDHDASNNSIIQLTTSNFKTQKGSRINWNATDLGPAGTDAHHANFFMTQFNGANPVTSLVNGVLWGGGTVGNNFATYDATRGVIALTTGLQTGAESVWVATDNVQPATLTGNITLNGNRVVNTLNIDAGTTARTLDLAGFTLEIGTGGFIQRGSGGLTVGDSVGTGSITAGASNELFLLGNAAPGIVVNAKIVNNANPVAVTIGGGNTIRLASELNSFTGGIYIGGSTLLAQTSDLDETGSTLGANTIYFPGNGTLNLRDASPGTSGYPSVSAPYGNDVVVTGAGTINVDRIGSTSTGQTFNMGKLTLADGRTLATTTGSNGYRIDFTQLILEGSGTINGAASTTIQGAVTLPAGKTFTKTGGGYLTFGTDNSATYLGSTVVNGGALQISHLNALGVLNPAVTVNNGGRFVVAVSNFDFSNITVNPGGILQIRQDQSILGGAVLPSRPISALEMQEINTISGDFDGVQIAHNGQFRLNTASGQTYNYQSDLTLLGYAEIVNGQNVTNTLNLDGVISGPGTLIRNQTTGTLNVNLNKANTYTGGTIATGGSGALRGQIAGAFGPGAVVALSGPIELNVAGAASNTVVAIDNTLSYNANGAASGNVIQVGGTHPLVGPYLAQNLGTGTILSDGKSFNGMHGQVNIGTAVNNFAGDTFDVRAYSIISGDSTRLALLSRGGNLTVERNSIIAHQTNSAATAQNLGANADLFFGLGANHTHALTIGANTPWLGISTDRADRRYTTGPISIDDGSNGGAQAATVTQVFFNAINGQQLIFGETNATTAVVTPVSIVPVAGGGKVEAVLGIAPFKLPGANGQENSNRFNIDAGNTGGAVNDFSGISLFRVYGNFYPNRDHSTAGVPIIVESGGQIDPPVVSTNPAEHRTGNPTGASTILLKAGAMMLLNDANTFQNAPAGRVTAEQDAIVRLAIAGALLDPTNSAVAPIFDFMNTSNGLVARIEASNITLLNEAVKDNATFVITGGDRSFNPSFGALGLALNGGMLTHDNADRTVIATNAATEAITVTGSATFAASRNRTFSINSDINATGADLTVGAVGVVDGYLKDGSVRFTGLVNGAKTMTLVGGANAYANTANGPKILDGTFASDGVTIGDLSRFELTVASATSGAALTVNQKFIIEGDYLHRDRRRFLVRRTRSTPDSGNGIVYLQNIFMKDGSVLAIDESADDSTAGTRSADVRVNATLMGDATFASGVNDQFEIMGVQSSVPGTRRTLTLGRTADMTGVPVSHNQSVYGIITGDITVNQVKGGLTFQPGSNLLAGAEIYNVGFGQSAGGSTLLEDGQVVIRAGQAGTGYLAGGKVYLNGDQDMMIYVDEVASGTQVVNNPATIVEIQAGTGVYPSGVGRIQANRNSDSTVNGRVVLNQVIVNNNSLLQLEHQSQQQLLVKNLTLAGNNSTVLNFSGSNDANSRVFISNISDAAADKTVTLTGRGIRVIPSPGETSSTLTAGKIVVDSNSLNLEPGAGNTATINSEVQVNTVLNITNGTSNFGATVIKGQAPQTAYVAGLRENVLPGNNNDTTNATPTGGLVRLGTDRAQYPYGFGFTDNTTVVYTGQINIPDNGVAGDGQGAVAFAESFDDNFYLQIDVDGNGTFDAGEIFNNDGSANFASGVLAMSTGWHNFEIRLGQGGGGSGPWSQAGWNKLMGFGIDLTDPVAPETTGSVMANYVAPVDNGTMNLFRTTTTGYAGTVNVSAGATLNAAGIQDIDTTTVAGNANVDYIRTRALSLSGAGVANLTPGGGDAGHSRVSTLTFAGSTGAWTGQLQMNDNLLIVDAPNMANLMNQLKSGRANGAWTGQGVVSANAAADAQKITAYAVMLNTEDGVNPIFASYAGQTVSATSAIGRYTYNGDSTFDGTVDADDYFQIDAGFVSGGTKTGWRWGDYNYDGVIDIDDYFLIDVAYVRQGAPLGVDAAPVAPTSPSAAVPEPGTLSLLSLGAAALLGRRRRSK